MTKTRTLSTAAAAAKAIRKQLKAAGIPARVTSENFSGGNAVNITLTNNPMPATVAAVRLETAQYQYGSFDSMTDSYDYTNRRDDIPQVRYLSVDVEFTADMEQIAWDYLRGIEAGWSHCPERYSDLRHTDCNSDRPNDWAQNAVLRVLIGEYDRRLCGSSFWAAFKPRQRAA